MVNNEKKHGIRTINIFLPTIIAIGILYTLIIVSTAFITKFNKQSAENTQTTSECIETITSLQTSIQTLHTNAILYAYEPTIANNKDPENNQQSWEPIDAYYKEYKIPYKKPQYIREKLLSYNFDNNVNLYVEGAVEQAEKIMTTHSHAFALIKSISYVDSEDKIEKRMDSKYTFFKYDLPEDELALTDEEKASFALELLLGDIYVGQQNALITCVEKAVSSITAKSVQTKSRIEANYSFARAFLWTSISLIIVATTFFFTILLKRLVFPITTFANNIKDNQRLDSSKTLYEAKVLADAYNELLDRHDEYEANLKTVAEFDSLTGLPNRYCYNSYLAQPITEDKSTCVFLLDINNLKYVNDTFGHSKGDELIKNATQCIKDCFLNTEMRNCYRIGGDEFVAILDNIEEKDIDSIITKFKARQKELNVSIALGHAYSTNVKETGYDKLIAIADQEMYKNKNEMYEKGLVNY